MAQTDPSGEKSPHYIISDRPMTEEEWIRERWWGMNALWSVAWGYLLYSFAFITGTKLEDKFRRYLDLSKAGLAAEHRWLRSLLGALKHKRAQTGTE